MRWYLTLVLGLTFLWIYRERLLLSPSRKFYTFFRQPDVYDKLSGLCFFGALASLPISFICTLCFLAKNKMLIRSEELSSWQVLSSYHNFYFWWATIFFSLALGRKLFEYKHERLQNKGNLPKARTA